MDLETLMPEIRNELAKLDDARMALLASGGRWARIQLQCTDEELQRFVVEAGKRLKRILVRGMVAEQFIRDERRIRQYQAALDEVEAKLRESGHA